MSDAFKKPNITPLTAASLPDHWWVHFQIRDKYGKWIEQGGVLGFGFFDEAGNLKHEIGHAIGPDRNKKGNVLILIKKHPITGEEGNWVVSVPGRISEVAHAEIGEDYLNEHGVRMDVNGNAIGNVKLNEVPKVGELGIRPATSEDIKLAAGKISDEDKKAQQAVRAEAPAHVSTNVLENGKGHANPEEHAPANPMIPRGENEKLPDATEPKPEAPAVPAAPAQKIVDENNPVKNIADVKGIEQIITDPDIRSLRSVYEPQRTEDDTKFEVVSGNHEGAVAFITAHKNADGKWEHLDPRQRGANKVVGTYDSREEAELHAMNALAGAEEQEIAAPTAKSKVSKTPKLEKTPNTTNPPKSEGATPQPEDKNKITGDPDADFSIMDALQIHDGNIDNARLTAAQKKIFKKMKEYRQGAIDNMKKSAVENDEQKFKRSYAIAKVVSDGINKFTRSITEGNEKYADFLHGSDAARSSNLRILTDHTKFKIDNNGQKKVDYMEALTLDRSGRPMLLRYNEDGGGSVRAHEIDKDGNVVTGLDLSTGGDNPDVAYVRCDHPEQYYDDEIVNTPGMIGVPKRLRAGGIGGQMMLFARFKHMQDGSLMGHSSNQKPKGNLYSKRGTKFLGYHAPSQRERALLEQGLQRKNADGTSAAFTPAAIRALVSSGLLSRGDSFFNDLDTQWSSSNSGTLSSIESALIHVANKVRDKFKGDPNARAGVDYPEIFEDHVKSQEPYGDLKKIKFLDRVLSTHYQEGASKDEVIAHLENLHDSALKYMDDNDPGNRYYDRIKKMKTFSDAFKNENIDPAELLPPQKPTDVNQIRKYENPLNEAFKDFDGFKYPDGIKPLQLDGFAAPASYNALSIVSKIQRNGNTPEAINLLRSALDSHIANKTDEVSYDGKGYAPEAVFQAFDHLGLDANAEFAKAYDKALGGNENATALKEFRKDKVNSKDEMQKIVDEIGGAKAPVAFDEIGGNYQSGIVYGDPVRRNELDPNDDPALALKDLHPNAEFLDRANNYSIDSRPYIAQTSLADWIMQGTTDNPRVIARNFSPRGLQSAFENAAKNAKSTVRLKFSNGEERDIDVRAIRDALQHQGTDTNELIGALDNMGKAPNKIVITRQDYNAGGGEDKIVTIGARKLEIISKKPDGAPTWSAKDYVIHDITGEERKFVASLEYDKDSKNWKFIVGDPNSAPNLDDSRNADDNFLGHLNEIISNKYDLERGPFANRLFSGSITNPKLTPVEGNPNEFNIGFIGEKLKLSGDPKSGTFAIEKLNEKGELVKSFGSVQPTGDGTKFKATWGEPGYQKSAVFNNYEEAKKYLGNNVSKNFSLEKNIVTGEDALEPSKYFATPQAGSAVVKNATAVVDADGKKIQKGEFTVADGRHFTYEAKVDTKKHPAYRVNQMNYVFAEIKFKRGDDDSSMSGSVIQVGRGRWMVKLNDHGNGEILSLNKSFGDKFGAYQELNKYINEQFGIKSEDRIAPTTTAISAAERAAADADKAAAEAEAKRQAELAIIQDRIAQGLPPLTDEQLNDILAEQVANPVDLSAGNLQGGEQRAPGGVNGAQFVQTRDGRKWKIKDHRHARLNDPKEVQRRTDSEILAAAMWRAGLVQSTTPQRAVDANGKDVIADPRLTPINRNWHEIWRSRNDPRYEQAREDARRGALLDAVMGMGDIWGNSGNIILVKDADGVIRAKRCDGGGNGFAAAGTLGERELKPDGARRHLENEFGDLNRNGGSGFGFTSEKWKKYARETIVPLNEERIRTIVDSVVRNPRDRERYYEGYLARRNDILSYLGLDEHVIANPAPYNPVVPIERDAAGRQLVDLQGDALGLDIKKDANGDHYIHDGEMPDDVRDQIMRGNIIPKQLPFLVDGEDPNGPRIDGDGNFRENPKHTVVVLRSKDANGNYVYHVTKQKKSATNPGNNDKQVMFSKEGLLEPAQVLDGVVGNHDGLLNGAEIKTQEIQAGGSTVRVHLVDVGDKSMADHPVTANARPKYSRASQKNIGHDELKQLVNDDKFMNNIKGGEEDFLKFIKDSENADAAPKPEDANEAPEQIVPSLENVVSSKIFRSIGGGAYKRVTDANGNVEYHDMEGTKLGLIRKASNGDIEAIFMPDHIGNQERNGSAVKAVFSNANKEGMARNWLGDMMAKHKGESHNLISNQRVGAAGDQNKIIAHKGGHLNKPSDRQIAFARRLVNSKQMTPEEHEQFKATLGKDSLVEGEIASIIGKLSAREEVSPSELNRRVEALKKRLNAGNANDEKPQVPDVVDTNNPPAMIREKAIKHLSQGDMLIDNDGNAMGHFVGMHRAADGNVNVAVIDADNKVSIKKFGENDRIKYNLVPRGVEPTNQALVDANNGGNKTLEDIKKAFPNHTELPNGDLLIHEKKHTQRGNGRTHLYQLVLHRTGPEEFVSYWRRQEIGADGKPFGPSEATNFAAYAHSSVAAIKRINTSLADLKRTSQPHQKFLQRGDTVPEIVNPATGNLLPRNLVPDANAKFVGNTGIEATGDGIRDGLVRLVANMVDRRVDTDEIIKRLTGADQNILSKHQIADLVERVAANRKYPGTQQIPYVSKDRKTIVRAGDSVNHYDADGNFLKSGRVVSRKTLQVYVKSSGQYEYKDILNVQFPGRPGTTPIAARRLEVTKRADGAEPIPAVAEPIKSGEPNVPNVPNVPAEPNTPAEENNLAGIPNYDLGDDAKREEVAENLKAELPDGYLVQHNQNVNGAGGHIVVMDGNRNVKAMIADDGQGNYKAQNMVNGLNEAPQDQANLGDALGFVKNAVNGVAPAPAPEAPVAPNAPQAPAVAKPPKLVFPTRDRARVMLDGAMMPGGDNPRNVFIGEDGQQYRLSRNNDNGIEATYFNTVDGTSQHPIWVEQQDDGNWQVRQGAIGDADNKTLAEFKPGDRKGAEAYALNMIRGAKPENAPAEPEAPKNSESNNNVFENLGQEIDRYKDKVPEGFAITKSGANDRVYLIDKERERQGLIAMRARIFKQDGKIMVQRYSKNGGIIDKVEARDLNEALNMLNDHAKSLEADNKFANDFDLSNTDNRVAVIDRVKPNLPDGWELKHEDIYSGLITAKDAEGKAKVSLRKHQDKYEVAIRNRQNLVETESFDNFNDALNKFNKNLDEWKPKAPANEVENVFKDISNKDLTLVRERKNVIEALKNALPDGYSFVEKHNGSVNRPVGSVEIAKNGELLFTIQNNRTAGEGKYKVINGSEGNQENNHFENLKDAMNFVKTNVGNNAPAPANGNAPAAPAEANNGDLPMGYKENDNPRSLEITPDTDDYEAMEAPHASINRIGNKWHAEYFDRKQDYQDGKDANEVKVFDSKEEARAHVLGKMNAEFDRRAEEQEKADAAKALPKDFVKENIDEDGNAFEIKHGTDADNKPYALIEKGSDGKWNAMKWESGKKAADNRYRRADASKAFDTPEEAQAWAKSQLVPSGGSGKSLKDFSDVHLGELDKAILQGYPSGELSERMAQALELKRQFQQGFVDENPANFRGGINATRRIKLADGTYAFLKVSNGRVGNVDDDAKRELLSARMFEAVGLKDHLVMAEVVDPASGKKGIIFKQFEHDLLGRNFQGNVEDLENAREVALVDYLIANEDRHGGNWLVQGNKMLPIDNGISHGDRDVIDIDRLKRGRGNERNGELASLLANWAKGNNQLFSKDEVAKISENIKQMESAYDAMGMGNYFRDVIMKRLDVIQQIANNQ